MSAPPAFDWGRTGKRRTAHLVAFEADNVLCTDAQPDRTLCGRSVKAEHVEPPERGSGVCQQCVRVATAERPKGVVV